MERCGELLFSSASRQERAATPHQSLASAFTRTGLSVFSAGGVEGFWERLAGEEFCGKMLRV